jgi:5-methylcytosine-specific restriction endonuclease McrA
MGGFFIPKFRQLHKKYQSVNKITIKYYTFAVIQRNMPTITHKRRKRQPEKIISRKVDNSDIYNSSEWRRARKAFKSQRENAFCVKCLELGIYTVTYAVDHIIPITQGGSVWDRSNWQPLCKTHHNQKSGREAHSHFDR